MHASEKGKSLDHQVSVIIPCYNAEEHIDATILSVLGQTHQNFEIILIDDHSKDKTFLKLQDWAQKDTRIRITQTEKNTGGPATGRNIGMKLAKGYYVAFLDADDLWHPRKLEIQINLMEKHQVAFSFTEKYNFADAQDYLKVSQKLAVDEAKITTKIVRHGQLLCKNVIPTSSVLLKTSLACEIDFDTEKKTIAVEDYKKWLYTHQKINFSLGICCPFLGYRVHPQNLSKQKWKMFKKVNTLLSEYQVSGRGLGLMKYFYLTTYVVRSVCDLVSRKVAL